MARPRIPMTIAPGKVLTAFKVEALRHLARAGARGSCAVHPVMPGGTLAQLVDFGLAEHAPAIDSLGGRRYRVSAAGREMLTRLGFDAEGLG
jgi:hypothetical protein